MVLRFNMIGHLSPTLRVAGHVTRNLGQKLIHLSILSPGRRAKGGGGGGGSGMGGDYDIF